MQFPDRHPWTLSSKAAVALQKQLAGEVDLHDHLPAHLRWVAGVDVSYQRQADRFHGAVVLMDMDTDAVVETATATREGAFPYIPGLLSFRELPALLAAFRKVHGLPEVILVDGQGIAHPRRFGLASHLGLWLNLPTIGCAKSRLCGEAREPGELRGEHAPMLLEGEPVGAVVRTRDRVKSLYVSPGHRVSIEQAVKVVLQCGRGYRLPEPTRLAHLASNLKRLAEEKP